ncbi:MAG: Polyphosphate kinase, partial [Acidobacteriaceae bacterium]|nr:Polyphosphate kinase [Acidobacteriaceae bacterium]
MARVSLDNPANFINREVSWLAFNRRVLEEAQDESNPLLERLKFLSITASNLDEFFEVRVASLVQQIEDGNTEAAADGLTMLEERDAVSRITHDFVEDQYHCWNNKLLPALAQSGIRVLGINELDAKARAFVDDYCEKELDLLLTPVTVDPSHPFP